MNYPEIAILLMPEIILTGGALFILLMDLKVMRDRPSASRGGLAAGLTCITCVAAVCWLVRNGGHAVALPEGMLVISPLTQFLKVILLLLTAFTALISVKCDFTDHVGEFFVLLLLATVGMMFLVSAENLLMVFVALELLSLSLYIMTGFNKRNIRSAEAALKYFLFGGMSASFLLFGFSLVYGVTGAVSFQGIAEALPLGGRALDPLFTVGLVMTVIGLGFKVAAVPFHLWAPDAYEGAPAPSAAFIASGSKVASFYVLARLMTGAFGGAQGGADWVKVPVEWLPFSLGKIAFEPGWVAVLAIVAVLSMVLGNLTAIVQTSVRRLLAYSAIAHAGYALLGVMGNGEMGMASLLYYVITYAVSTLGAFAVVAVVQDHAGTDSFRAFSGLSRRSPVVALCMLIFILSLAGIPPLAGFFGKFYVFVAAVGRSETLGLLWLVIAAIAMSAVSLYYYLQVLKEIYVTPAADDAGVIEPGLAMKCSLILLALAVVVLGCLPNLLVGRLLAALS